MQPQSESPENPLDFKDASSKEILNNLDKFEWKPEYLRKSEDVDQRVKLYLQYVTACSECLVAATESGNLPQCSWFCKDCMKYKRVCSEHEDLYTDWLCDARQCEQYLRRSDKCVRFSVLLSTADQAFCCEKYGKFVSSSLWATLDGQGKLSYPVRLIHNVVYCLKNPQASLERDTHFDGHFTYDSKHLWIAACTSNEQQHSMLFEGLSQRALSQLDKGSEELASQRVNDPVISTLKSIFCFPNTDILELYKPWTSTSLNQLEPPGLL